MNSFFRDYPGLDRIRVETERTSGRMMPADLAPLFTQVGVTVGPSPDRGSTGPWFSRRPCTACWRIIDGRLLLADLWDLDGHAGRFVRRTDDSGVHAGIRSPIVPLPDAPDAIEPDSLRRVLLPGVELGHAVFADWVDEELVLLEGDELFEFGGPFPDNFERNRVIRVERGVVTRTWVRHHSRTGDSEDAEPVGSPNWSFKGPKYPPTLGMRERYMKKQVPDDCDQRMPDQHQPGPNATDAADPHGDRPEGTDPASRDTSQ